MENLIKCITGERLHIEKKVLKITDIFKTHIRLSKNRQEVLIHNFCMKKYFYK